MDCNDGGILQILTDLTAAITANGTQIVNAIEDIKCSSVVTVNQELNENLQEILSTMANNCTCGNCSNSGGSGSSAMPALNPCNFQSPFTPPTQTPTGGDFPPSFGTYENYLAYRCQTAQAIVAAVIAFSRKMTVGNITAALAAFFGIGGTATAVGLIQATFTIEELATLGIGTLTLAAILIPLILAISAVIVTASSVAFDDIGNLLEAAKDDIVCALLNAVDALDAKTTMLSAIQTILTLNNIQLDGWLINVYDQVFGIEVFYRLFKDGRGEMGNLSDFTDDCDCGEDPPEGGTIACKSGSEFETGSPWFISDQGGVTNSLTASEDGLTWVAAPGAFQPMVSTNLSESYVVQPGDTFQMCFSEDPTALGLIIQASFEGEDSVFLENSGSVVDHIALRCYSLEDYVGLTLTRIDWSINRAGGGTWIINSMGIGCDCADENCP